jgi:hypothetical protein
MILIDPSWFDAVCRRYIPRHDIIFINLTCVVTLGPTQNSIISTSSIHKPDMYQICALRCGQTLERLLFLRRYIPRLNITKCCIASDNIKCLDLLLSQSQLEDPHEDYANAIQCQSINVLNWLRTRYPKYALQSRLLLKCESHWDLSIMNWLYITCGLSISSFILVRIIWVNAPLSVIAWTLARTSHTDLDMKQILAIVFIKWRIDILDHLWGQSNIIWRDKIIANQGMWSSVQSFAILQWGETHGLTWIFEPTDIIEVLNWYHTKRGRFSEIHTIAIAMKGQKSLQWLLDHDYHPFTVSAIEWIVKHSPVDFIESLLLQHSSLFIKAWDPRWFLLILHDAKKFALFWNTGQYPRCLASQIWDACSWSWTFMSSILDYVRPERRLFLYPDNLWDYTLTETEYGKSNLIKYKVPPPLCAVADMYAHIIRHKRLTNDQKIDRLRWLSRNRKEWNLKPFSVKKYVLLAIRCGEIQLASEISSWF